jgi:hypothetical protein
MYDTSFEDFSSKDLSQLDTWVFDKVEQFFERAASDPDLQMKLRQDKIVLVIFNRIFGCLGVNVLFRADINTFSCTHSILLLYEKNMITSLLHKLKLLQK